jgi:flavin reductase (DIM6/NTAB) family NADH-FMN oxidoreductase RutF
MSFDSLAFRQAMGRFATGVTVVTAVDAGGAPVGVTVNSFGSVSLDPPLVLFSLDRQAMSFAVFADARHFAVNVLRDNQSELSEAFANAREGIWTDLAYQRWESGSPILADCLANIECARDRMHDGGDHVIMVGRVLRIAYAEAGSPLVYFGGRYRRLEGPLGRAIASAVGRGS